MTTNTQTFQRGFPSSSRVGVTHERSTLAYACPPAWNRADCQFAVAAGRHHFLPWPCSAAMGWARKISATSAKRKRALHAAVLAQQYAEWWLSSSANSAQAP